MTGRLVQASATARVRRGALGWPRGQTPTERSTERPHRLDRLRDDRAVPRERRPHRGGGARHRLRAQPARRRRRRRHHAAGRGARSDGRLRARHAHGLGAARRARPTASTMEEAQDQVLDYIREWVPEPRKAPLGGNTVGTDRGFLARDMAELEAHLHYRIIDVSSIKELVAPLVPAGLLQLAQEGRRPPRARRHPRVDRRAALLPRGRLRAAARPRHRHRAHDRVPSRDPQARTAGRMPPWQRGGHEHPSERVRWAPLRPRPAGCRPVVRMVGVAQLVEHLRCGRRGSRVQVPSLTPRKVGRAPARGHGPHPFPAAWAPALDVGWMTRAMAAE